MNKGKTANARDGASAEYYFCSGRKNERPTSGEGRSKKFLFKNPETNSTRPIRNQTGRDQNDKIRDLKLEAMRAHKLSVERRMRPNNNNEGQMYWSQRSDKLKRYPKHEALDPSWYTDNIYSNDSIDLDEDKFTTAKKPEECHSQKYQYGINDYVQESFDRKKGEHNDIDYNYPKSRSCCFGSGYDERPKLILMPKSNSFSTSSTHRDPKSNRFRQAYRINEEEDFANEDAVDRTGIRSCYCWENGHQRESCDRVFRNGVYHIDGDTDKCNNRGDDRDRSNAHYMRKSWRNCTQLRHKAHYEMNGNYVEDFNPNNSFEEEYLIVQQEKPIRVDNYDRNGYGDDLLSISRRESQYSGAFAPTFSDENANKSYDQIEEANLNGYRHRTIKSKSMLEVKPPKRYDDSSSDSTDLDLDDFSFDFEKYWNELDKSTSNSSATVTSNHHYDLDFRIDNSEKGMNQSANQKLNTIDRLERRKKKMHHNTDFSDELMNAFDSFDVDDAIDVNENFPSSEINNQYYNTYSHKINFPGENLMSPRRCASRQQYKPTFGNQIPHDKSFRGDRFIPEPNGQLNNGFHCGDKSAAAQSVELDKNGRNNNKNASTSYGGAINLINNIFSIYKPRKYSPINCRSTDSQMKPTQVTKIMNVPSTVRPLGAPYNDFITSMKRPLTISSSCFTSKRPWTGPTPSVDQPYFKIIPQKTGLKISPLYPFGFDDDDYKSRLKCTARPLLFPI